MYQAMDTIGAFDAKTRLGELLERTARGERFLITKHGRPVGMLVPAEPVRDREKMARAVAELKKFRHALRGLTREELINLKNEGRRY